MNIFEVTQFLKEIKVRDNKLINKLYNKYGSNKVR